MNAVNDFNQRTRRDQPAAERKFIEARLQVATADLRAAEDRMQQFLQGNRVTGSPDLQFTRDRLQREFRCARRFSRLSRKRMTTSECASCATLR